MLELLADLSANRDDKDLGQTHFGPRLWPLLDRKVADVGDPSLMPIAKLQLVDSHLN